jgi:AraC family transcriptional regulator, transcriptional activator of pobA
MSRPTLTRKHSQDFHNHEQLLQALNLKSDYVGNGFSVNINEVNNKAEIIEGRFRTDYFIICLVTCGSVTLNIDLKTHHVLVNGFFVAPPNALKQLIEASEDATFSIVSFTSDFLNKIGVSKLTPELLEYFSTKFCPVWQLDVQASELLAKLMEDLRRRDAEVKSHPFGKELLYSCFETFLYEIGGLSQIYAVPVSNKVSRKENLVMEFMHVLKKHFKTTRSVIAYADLLSVTPKYLTETVKEITGKNAGEIIDDVVVLEASYMLDNPVLSIGQVADMLNFKNQSFFGKYFKRHVGLSPKEYRKPY